MVLEKLFPASWLERRLLFSIVLGFLYSIIGIVIARLIFGANAGIVSVMFLSLMLVPTLRKLTILEEIEEERETTFSFSHLYRNTKHLFEPYAGLFIGVFAAYFFSAFLLPQLGINVFSLLREQMFLDPALAGRATFDWPLFISILQNNWLVLLATFALALIIGDGAFFFVAWNASAWGTIFGYRILTASIVAGVSPLYYLAIVFAFVAWHIILEGSAYMLASISGSMISRDVVHKSKDRGRFLLFLVVAIMAYVLWMLLFQRLPVSDTAVIFSSIAFLIVLLSLLRYAFQEQHHKTVYVYNYMLFVFAVICFLVGVLIETGVLTFGDMLTRIYQESYMYSLRFG